MLMFVSRLHAAGLVAALLLAATAPGQTVLLRFKPPVGTTVSYTMTMSLVQKAPGMAKPMAFSQVVPMTLRAVSRSGGGTTLQTKTGQAKVTLPAGSPMAAMKAAMEKQASGTTATTVVDELGNLKTVNAATGANAAMARGIGTGMMAGAQGVAYPKRALKVGDAWTASLDMGKAMGGVMGGAIKAKGSLPIVYRLTGIQKRGGRTLAQIAVTMKGGTSVSMGANAMKMALDSTGTMFVDADTGLLDSMAISSVTDMAFGAAGQSMRQSMTMTMKSR